MYIKNGKDAVAFIEALKGIDGALSYDGDCSVQVVFQLKNGKVLRFGITDEDVARGQGLWFDQFPGLFGELKNYV